MSRLVSLAILSAAVAALAAGAAVAGGQPASTAHAGRTVTLRFVAAPRGGSGLDLRRKGPSVGDQFFEHGRLTGAASGRFQLVTQLVAGNGRRGTERSSISLRLRRGTIETEGTHATASRYRMPVVGGTGAYAGARGVLSAVPARHGRVRLTVRLGR